MDKEPVIKSLTLQGFRSIAAERIELDNPTILVGPNGAGKTNIVDAFALLAEAMTSPLETVVARRGGVSSLCHKPEANSFGLAMSFGAFGDEVESADYAFKVVRTVGESFEIETESCQVGRAGALVEKFDRQGFGEKTENGQPVTVFSSAPPPVDRSALLLPFAGGHKAFAPLFRFLSNMRSYSIDPNRVRELQDPVSGTSLSSDGSNAASVLQRMARDANWLVERIGELLGAILPHEISVRPVQYGNKLAMQFTQRWGEGQAVTFEAASMSEGTLRVLGLLLAVFQEPTPSLILIEEPEASVHPGALSLVSDLIQIASDRTQVIVTTHSPELLDMKWIEDRHLRLVSWENGATRVSRISDGTRRVLQKHLAGAGQMLRTNSLDAAPLPELDTDQIELFQKIG